MKRWIPGAFGRASAALALVAAMLPAAAATVSFSFVAPVTSGLFSGESASGVIRFDDSFSGALTPAFGAVEIDISFLGQSFDESQDPGFPDFPELTVLGGVPIAIDFVLTQGAAGVDFADVRIRELALQGVLTPGGTASALMARIDVLTGDPLAVPEPSTLGLAGLALLGLGRRRRRLPH